MFEFNRYRQVDPVKLNTLKDLINAPNYKDNLSTLIRTIYEFAFLTYAGKFHKLTFISILAFCDIKFKFLWDSSMG